jgi:hypothetical protein
LFITPVARQERRMAEDALADRLSADERIVWSGRPDGGLLFTTTDVFGVPLSLFLCILTIGLIFKVAAAPHPAFLPTAGVALASGYALFTLAGRFALDIWIRRGTLYAITERRILISLPGPFPRFTQLNLGQLPGLYLVDRENGRGDIRFAPQYSLWFPQRRIQKPWTLSLDRTPQFLAIDDARGVFDLIQKLAAGAPR